MGLPPVNGAPADVNRKNFYGSTDDRTIQDVVNLNATISHRFTPAVTLRNQRSTRTTRSAHASRAPTTSAPSPAASTAMFPATNLSNTTSLPYDLLFVGLGSHDRNITDTSLYNQTDLITEFVTGPIKHALIAGLELGQDTNNAQNYSRNIPGNPNNYFLAVSLPSPAYEPAGGLPSVTGNLVQASATDVAPYVSDTMSIGNFWKAIAGVRYDRYNASLTNTISLPPSASQSVGFTSVRAGVIYQPTETQSYYLSLRHVVQSVARDTRAHQRPAKSRPRDESPVRTGRQMGSVGRQPVAHRRDLRYRKG